MYKVLKRELKKCISKNNYPPQYSPQKWNNKKFNCYLYALDLCMDFQPYLDDGRIVPGIPGFLSRAENNDYREIKEKTLQYFIEDCEILNLNISETTLDEKINKNEYKIAVYVEEYDDFHFVRQDSNGKWSEKAGWGGDIRQVKKEDIVSDSYKNRYKFIGMFKVSKK